MSSTPSSPSADTPSPDLFLSDKSTITTILTVVVGLIATIHPGFSLSPFIPAIGAVITGLAPLVLIASKHHFARQTDIAVAKQAIAQLPAIQAQLPEDVKARIEALETWAVNWTNAMRPPATPTTL